ncbi:hypothetical protein NLI96_g9347 [Meripilus lineatus]|uniref:Major facilitator superfamily (MFS) profile domain-containing protein n=1 Tax=Meripilus lineatus TaxID=2056292 RepID=A0AAD5UVM4_9APHY|nr:hypothetical protein NLI96_g9347 [Physisporinus lineatus]
MADAKSSSLHSQEDPDTKEQVNVDQSPASSQFDLLNYHEHNAGRLVVDPEEAKIEFGEAVASRLKLSKDGTKVLWPQPTDDPEDPQNWSDFRKGVQLFIITLAAIVPDFDSGIGIADIFALATQYNTTTGVINNLTSKCVFAICSYQLASWFLNFTPQLEHLSVGMGWYICGDAHASIWPASHPLLVPGKVLALGFLVGCTFAPNLNTFTAMRCLTAIFGTCPQVTICSPSICKQERYGSKYDPQSIFASWIKYQLNIWTMGFILSPFISPFAFGFMVARENWRWTYGIGSMYGAIVVGLIVLFMEETMYDRKLPNPKPIPRPASRIRYRIETLTGITGARMAKYRDSWRTVVLACLDIVWRPHLFMILWFEALLFGFSIGINVTNAVFLGTPPPVGYGISQFAIAGAYGTPIVAVLIGEVLGRYFNDWVMNFCIRRNKGVFEAEFRLWTCYIAIPLYICGFVVLGAAIQKHLTIGALVMGWGIAEVAVMINTVAVYAYCNDCFPRHQGEISALINLARTLGGFSVAYFQVPWATKHGGLQTFGVEAAIVVGLFLLIVPALQIKGRYLRQRYSG